MIISPKVSHKSHSKNPQQQIKKGLVENIYKPLSFLLVRLIEIEPTTNGLEGPNTIEI
jgi:hypothetical protein